MTVQERIKAIRKSTGLSQAEFGARINVTNGLISNVERGTSILTERTLAAICREFGVSRTWLDTGEGEMWAVNTADTAEDLVPALVDLLEPYPDLLATLRRAVSIMTPDDMAALNDFVRRLSEADEKEE